MTPAQLRARYRRIVTFFAGVTASFIYWEIVLPKLGLVAWTNRTRVRRERQIAARFRMLAIGMGGLMIKVGQFLSARMDVLPAEITDELSGLQDEVPPAAFADIKAKAEAEFGRSLDEVYESFDPVPLAAASLGQAHRARLRAEDAADTGFTEVVVKVQRPWIDEIVQTDLAALRRVGQWLTRYRPIAKRADVPALVEEFAHTTLAEIDYLAEAGNAGHFAEAFDEDPLVRVPQVAWEHSTTRVLTLEDVSAIRIGDYDAIIAAGIDPGQVAHKLVELYLQQIFTDGVFHADPHPGNLFIRPVGEPGEFELTFIDFGMVGRIADNLRDGLREALIAIATQDAPRLVAAFVELDVLLPDADVKLLELAAAQVFDRFGGMTMGDLRDVSHEEMMSFGLQFRDLMVNMPFQLPENLLLLGRTIAMLSGMCTGLDENFNVWSALAPYTTKLVSGEGGLSWQTITGEGGKIVQTLIALPRRVDRVLTTVERGELSVRTPMLDLRMRRLERAANRGVSAMIFAALLLAGAMLWTVEPMLAKILMGVAVLPLLAVLFGGRRGHGPS
ncbi:MAG: ABC transporter [Actinobacteria bacterium HGW-Actinobacteria-2]|nr:MAG: ABC transporter [Actinobacteria bacterium HGW-Actinobacteria-2]